jgi:CBS domain-containing protein
MRVEQLMTRDVKVCRADDMLSRAAQLMWEYDCGCLPVISTNGDGKLRGIITDRDIAMAAYIQGWPLSAIAVSSVISREVVACHVDDGISKAEALMRDHRVRRLPVLDRDQRLAEVS